MTESTSAHWDLTKKNHMAIFMMEIFLCPKKACEMTVTAKEILGSFLFCIYLGSFTMPLPLHKGK